MISHDNAGLSPLDAVRRNRSFASINSDAATFHSAQALPHAELERIQMIEHANMSRTDSGFEDGCTRSSTSNSTCSSKRRRHSTSKNRPSTKRASRSAPSVQRLSARPRLQSRYTTSSSNPQTAPVPSYEFFHFPTLTESLGQSTMPLAMTQTNQEEEESEAIPPPAPPPATVHYWTSVETRRLEYAAIDAASRGVRGFLTRLIPDCILPAEFRRTKFSNGDEVDDDAGSVRRYRLSLPDEKSMKSLQIHEPSEQENAMKTKRPGLLQRLSFSRKSTS